MIDGIPLWLFLIIAIVMSAVFLECGRIIGQRKRVNDPDEPEAPIGAMVGAILGLLAFMMAFTFNVAINRFDERRAAVLDEANAIGTTYLRADFLDQQDRDETKRILREYVKKRLGGLGQDDHDSIMKESASMQEQLWQIATRVAHEKPTPISASFVTTLNEMIDLHSKRVTLVLHTRVPTVVWLSLFAVSLFSMMGVGFYCGLAGSKNRTESIILLSTFSIVLLLVADLDRPAEGFLKTNQQPMIDLYASISSDH